MHPEVQIANDTQMLWVIDPTHSTVEFAVRKLFFFTVRGNFTKVEGSLAQDSVDVGRSSVAVALHSASVSTGNNRRDRQLRGAKFLDVDRFPEIRFQSSRVERGTDRDTLRVTGSLTVKGTTREIVLEVSEIDRSRSPNGEFVVYYSAVTEIDRIDFRVNTMRFLIGRKIRITINVQATRAA